MGSSQTDPSRTLQVAPALAQSSFAHTAWKFDPHNGYGGKTPDGEPWPFGYIIEIGPSGTLPTPLFEMSPLFVIAPERLHSAALLMAAAPDLLEVCLAFISKIGREGYYPTAGEPLTRKMRTAILKATGQEAPAFGDGSSRTATKANSGLNTINEVSQ